MTTEQRTIPPIVQVADWIEGESIYGWATRYHNTFGNDWRRTGEQLFGKKWAAHSLDLPTGLGQFCHVTKGLLGDPMQVMRSRTAIGFYWPFLDDLTQRVMRTSARESEPALTPIWILQGDVSRLGAQHALRHCPLCALECLERGYEPTRFLDHQLPGSWICTWHDCLLEFDTHARCPWVPAPADGIFGRQRATAPRERSALKLCAKLGQTFLKLDKVDERGLRMLCAQRLEAFGVSSANRVNNARVDEWFERSAIGQWLTRHPDVQKIPAKGWIGSLLRGRSKPQPLKWILLWAALWERDSVKDAIDAFTDVAPSVEEFGLFSNRPWAGYWTPHPLVAPAEVQAAFDVAPSIAEAAMRLGIEESTAIQWLFDDPVLSGRWQAKRSQAHSQQSRDVLLAHIERHPEVTLEELTAALPGDVRWLTDHSRAMLRQVRASLAEYRAVRPELALF